MKIKALVVLLAIFASITFAAALFAQEGGGAGWSATMSQEFQQKWGSAKTHPFEGTVVSHDVACHCFVIKGAKDNMIIQDDYAKFEQEYDKAKGLKIGEKASGTYKMVDMINYAVDVHQK
jgi:hypothetical protein